MLGSYLNFMAASTQLLVNPILGLQAKFNEEDFERFIKEKNYEIEHRETVKIKKIRRFVMNLRTAKRDIL